MTNRKTLRRAIAGILKQTSVSTPPAVSNISASKQNDPESSSENANHTQLNQGE